MAIGPLICVSRTVQTLQSDTQTTSLETVRQSVQHPLGEQTLQHLPDAKTSVLQDPSLKTESESASSIAEQAFMVTLWHESATPTPKTALKVITEIQSVNYAFFQPIANQTPTVNISSLKTLPKHAFLSASYQIMVTVIFGYASLYATILTLDKIQPDNVCQDAALMFHSPRNKIVCVYQDVQQNQSELSPKM